MKQYPKYKDSGIQWIGQIPEGWNVQALKYIGDARNGLTYSPMDVTDAGILVLRSSNIQDSKLAFEDNVYVKEAPDFLKMKKGDILICSRNGSLALVGKCVYIPEDMDAVFGAFMLRYRPHIPNRFIFYVVQEAIRKYKAYYATSTVNQLTVDVLGRMQVPLPPISEQELIVCYLDDKTAKIDEAVNLLEQQKADLQQYRKALISQTVTRGLNHNAKLKDSGIQWIGQIPETWKIDRLKNYYSFEKGKRAALYTSEYIGEHYGTFPVYSGQTENDGIMGTIDSFDYDVEECLFTTTVGAKVMTPKILHGKFSLSQNCLIMQAFANNVVNHYVYYMILKLFEHAKSQIPTYMQPSLRIEDLKKYICVIPPLSEQQAIADYLDAKTAKIDETIKRIDEQIADLRAYRTALISDVVTGKIDVRN